MAKEFFTVNEEQAMSKIRVLQSLVADQSLHDTPCPLLDHQLNELSVFSEKLNNEVKKLINEFQGR